MTSTQEFIMVEAPKLMDEKLKKQWVRALRSGKYKKGKGYLKTVGERSGKTTYCCLGVLCAITKTEHNDQAGYLPQQLAEAAKLYDVRQSELIDRNDGGDPIKRAWSFNKIADYIERNY